jgi:hypothetical protein
MIGGFTLPVNLILPQITVGLGKQANIVPRVAFAHTNGMVGKKIWRRCRVLAPEPQVMQESVIGT